MYSPDTSGVLATFICFRARDKVACVNVNPLSDSNFSKSSWQLTTVEEMISLITANLLILFFTCLFRFASFLSILLGKIQSEYLFFDAAKLSRIIE